MLLHLSRKYPELTFSIDYADEDFGHNVGYYVLKNGEEIDCFIPDGGTYESIKMAMQVQYGEPIDYFDCNDDVFIEIYNDEELSDYEKILVDIAYDNEVYPTEDCEWDKLVLERFKEKAMVDDTVFAPGQLRSQDLEDRRRCQSISPGHVHVSVSIGPLPGLAGVRRPQWRLCLRAEIGRAHV